MLDLGALERSDAVGARAAVLIDGLGARAGELRVPALLAAVAEIRKRAAEGHPPVGMLRLAEVLDPAPVPPAPRQPIGDAAAVIECVRRYPSVVLDVVEPAAVARMLEILVGDGLRIVVTSAAATALSAVRAALPAAVRGLCLEGPEPLSATELRELRALLATETPRRAERADQLLPEWDDVPDPDLVARLCKAAGRPGLPPTNSAELVPELLGQLPAARLTGLIDTARRCDVAMSVLNTDGAAPWSWDLLESLLFGQVRRLFERLTATCRETVAAAEGLREVGDQLALIGTIPPAGLAQLRRYADFLDAGGRSRSYFRSPQQRAVEPVLRQLRLDDVPMQDSTLLRQALAFVELIAVLERVGADCRLLELPVPPDVPSVARLLHRLEIVEEAVRAVDVLRHEVLFIHPDSPVSMPDMVTTENVARAIIDSGGAEQMADARRRLAELTERFAATLPASFANLPAAGYPVPALEVDLFAAAEVPPDEPAADGEQPAPEYLDAVRALRENRLPDYLVALHELAGAHRERAEQRRLVTLLDRLRAAAPGWAEAWRRSGGRTFAPGTLRFRPVHEMLATLPRADSADAVLLLGADSLNCAYLVVAAAAPRLLVASGAGLAPPPTLAPPTGLAARLAVEGETVSTMVRRAGVPVVTVPSGSGTPGTRTPRTGTGSNGTGSNGTVSSKEPAA